MSDTIKELMALDDAALSKKLGFADRVAAFRKDLERANALSGTARANIENDLRKMFAPQTYAIEDLGWKVSREEKKANAPCKTTPASVIEDCGCADVAPC